jgi:uncharacterized membrane protein YbhN (UPF0104 family)
MRTISGIGPSRLTRLAPRSRIWPRVLFCTLATGGVVAGSVRAWPLLQQAIGDTGSAQPGWIVVATAAFLAAALCTATAWWSALKACNGTIGLVNTTSRYAVGCLVNTFVPARAGDAVRVGLLSRAFDTRNGLVTTAGVFVFLGLARGAVLAVVLLGAVASGLLPVNVLAVPLAVAICAVLLVAAVRARPALLEHERLRSLTPLRSAAPSLHALAWLVGSTLARLVAAAASAAALGIPNPLAAAAIIVPALEIANLVPLTPGNVGITSGVIAIALSAQGIGTANALAVGIVFHAVETIVGVSFGLGGTLNLARTRFPLVPRVAVAASALALLVAVGGVLGMLPDVA